MRSRLRTGFIGGFIGSVAVAGTLGLLVLLGLIPKAPFVPAYQSVMGGGWGVAAFVGGLLFVLIGALWAVPFAAFVSQPTIPKGILYGMLPTLWNWTFVPGVMTGGALFGGFTLMGLLLPVVVNCFIWGSIVGWFCDRRLVGPPKTTGHN